MPLGKARVVREGATSPSSPGARRCGPSRRRPSSWRPRASPSAEVIDVRTLSPFDFETVIASVSKTGRAVIVHEAPRTCGFGAEISAADHGAGGASPPGAGRAGHRLRHHPAARQAGGLLSAGRGDGRGRGQVAAASSESAGESPTGEAKESTWSTKSSWSWSKAGARCGPSSPTPSPTSWSTSSSRPPAGRRPASTCSRSRCWW